MDTEDQSIVLLDDEGKLFGVLNVVDALVLLLVLAVGIAGLSLVSSTGGSPPPQATTYVTIDLGTQPSYIASQVNEGDQYAPDKNSNLTVTDVYHAPANSGTDVVLRARLRGSMTEDGFVYSNAPPRLGRELVISTASYNLTGSIREVGESDDLTVGEETVVLQTTLPQSEKGMLVEGQQLQTADRTVGTVDDVVRYEDSNPEQHLLYLRTTLRTYRVNGVTYYGANQLRRGNSIGIPTGSGVVEATIRSVGGDFKQTAEVLVRDTVSANEAQSISTGDEYLVAGESVGTVESVSVYSTQNPDQKRVFVGLSLETMVYDNVPRFGAGTVRDGANISFQTPEYRLDGKVRRVGSTRQRGRPVERNVTLQMTDVSPTIADSLQVGMVESVGNDTVARLESIQRENASVVLISQDGNIYERQHPVNEDVQMTATLSLRETSAGVTFKGELIQQGSTVVLDFGGTTIEATVVSGYT